MERLKLEKEFVQLKKKCREKGQDSPIVSKKNPFLDKSVYLSTARQSNHDIVKKHIDFKIHDYAKISKKFTYNVNDIILMYLCSCCNKMLKKRYFQHGLLEIV
jgi:hypothetical protein